MGPIDWSELVGLAAALGVVIAAFVIARNRGKDDLIETQERQNAALRQELLDERRRCDERIAAQDRKIAELKGRVDLLSEQQGAAIGAAIAPVVARTVVQALHEGDWG